MEGMVMIVIVCAAVGLTVSEANWDAAATFIVHLDRRYQVYKRLMIPSNTEGISTSANEALGI